VVRPLPADRSHHQDGKIKVVKVNVDDSPQTAGAYAIRSIPSVLAFQNGVVVEQLMGARPKSAFVEMIEKLV